MEPKNSGLRQAPADVLPGEPVTIIETANNPGLKFLAGPGEVCRLRSRPNPLQDLSNSKPKQEEQ